MKTFTNYKHLIWVHMNTAQIPSVLLAISISAP